MPTALPATRSYQAAQVSLRALTYRDVAKLWPLLDPTRLDATFAVFAAAVLKLIEARRVASASLARSYLVDLRRGLPGAPPPVDTPPLSTAEALVSLRVVSVVSIKAAMTAKVPLEPAVRDALVRTMGAVDKFIGDAGRELIRASVEADPEAKGWRRRTLGTCGFCADLAAENHMHEGDADFPRHDHCGCTPEPAYTAKPQTAAFEEQFVTKILDQLAPHGLDKGIAELNRLLSGELNDLARANVTEALSRLEAQAQARLAGTVAGRVPIPDDVLALFKPGKWSTLQRDKMFEALATTPEGRRLAKIIEKFQSLSSRSIPLLRSDIEKYLSGETLAPGRAADIETLLSAIGNGSVTPKVLYRGMSIPGRVEDVMAHYQVGEEMNISLGSFTSDRYVAERFASGQTYGKAVKASSRKVAVRVEWAGDAKRALNIEKTALNKTIADEKEYLAAGKFVVERVRQVGDTVVVTIRQVGVW